MVFRIAETSSCLKNERKFFNKKNRKDQSCWVEKGKANTKWENFSDGNIPESDSKGYFRVSRKSFYELLIYKIAPIFAEETNSSKKLNVSRGSTGEGATGKL